VEPGEVERALLAVEGVERAVVVTIGEGADARLVAYVVTATESPEHIRAVLSERLPDYLVPSLVVPLDRIPLGPTGKVDRAALPVPGSESEHRRAPGSATRLEGEEGLVATMFAEIIGVDEVPADGDFFALGGNSLQAVRLLNKLRKHAAPDLPLAVLVERPTVAGIAAAIRENHRA
jgi:aryl carrier-like protein